MTDVTDDFVSIISARILLKIIKCFIDAHRRQTFAYIYGSPFLFPFPLLFLSPFLFPLFLLLLPCSFNLNASTTIPSLARSFFVYLWEGSWFENLPTRHLVYSDLRRDAVFPLIFSSLLANFRRDEPCSRFSPERLVQCSRWHLAF